MKCFVCEKPNSFCISFITLLLLLGMFFTPGCMTNKALRLSDKELFTLGKIQFDKKKYIKARNTFGLLVDTYPDSEYNAQAQLLKADAYFNEKSYIEAGVEYGLFVEFHPAHPKADYALFQEAECNFKHIKSVDRDQTNVLETEKKLKKLIALYPTSEYGARAKKRIALCQKLIQEHSLYVARFYKRWGLLKASISRYQSLLSSEPKPDGDFRKQISEELHSVKGLFREDILAFCEKSFRKKRYQAVVNGFEEFLKHFSADTLDENHLAYLITAYLELGKTDDAKDYIDRMSRKYPDNPQLMEYKNRLQLLLTKRQDAPPKVH